MKRTTSFRFGHGIRRSLESFRPNLETLEERLPPGDAVLSGVLAQAVAGAGLYSPAPAASAAALTTGPRPGHGMDYQVSAAPVPAGAGTFRPTFAAADFSSQDAQRTASAVGAGKDQARPAPHRPLELNPNLLDSLLEDNWDESAAPKPRQRFQPASPDGAPQPTTFLEGGGSAGPGSKDRTPSAPLVPPTTPSHGDIIAFPPQGEMPPDQGRVPPPPGSGGGVPPETPPEDDDCACNSSGQLNGNASGSTGGYDTGREFSDGPVRYFDGTVKYMATDIESSGFGESWGVTRTWTNGGWAAALPGTTNGSGIAVSQQPFLLKDDDSFIVLVDNSWNPHYFVGNDSMGYTADFFSEESLAYNSLAHDYVYRDSRGDQMKFYDFNTSRPLMQRGKLEDYKDPAQNDTQFIYDGSGFLTFVQHSVGAPGATTSEQFMYGYDTNPGPDHGLVSSVALQRQINSSGWTTVRQVNYLYYGDRMDGGNMYGAATDLRSATIKDGAGNTLDVYYYRYYTSTDMGSIGYVGGLKYVFSPQSYARLTAAGMGDPLTTNLTDAQVQNYADNYFQYTLNSSTSQEQVSLERVQGQGCACGGGNAGQGTYTFTYSTSSFAAGFNNWYYKTVETLPDNIPGAHTSQNVVYANYYGQVMLKVYQQQDAGQPLSQWATYYKYDVGDGIDTTGGGRTILQASPSAISGFSETNADLIDGYLNNNAGLIETTDYYTMTSSNISETQAGGVAGYVQDTTIQQGQLGTPALQSYQEYFARAAGGTTVYPVADTRVYRNATTNPNDSAKEETDYHYTWVGGASQVQSMIVAKPSISATENGPGVPDVDTTFFDTFGRPTWHRNSINPPDSMTADGYIDYTAYDQGTGAVIETIKDVDTTKTGDFFTPVPIDPHTGMPWVTPAGGGQHLKTTLVVDGLGRTIQRTSPSANVTMNRGGNITYTIYQDTSHEVRTYTWDAVANVQIGPTMVEREDRQYTPSYTETLTMTAPANLTGGQPDGTEAINDVQSLSRSFTSPGGQLIEKDDYFNFGNLVYTTDPVVPGALAGFNFYQTFYGYDDARGWLDRVQSPTGTITRTVYDGLHRVVSTWVGTNDTVAPTLNTPVDLSSAFNVNGITADGATFTGGLTGNGYAYSATYLNGTLTWNGLPFTLGSAGANNAVAGGLREVLNLPAGRDVALTLLATGITGFQANQSFLVTYTDNSTQTFSPSLSNWLTAQNSTGESTAVVMPHFNYANGSQVMQSAYLYAYTFALNPAKQVKSLQMPNNPDVVLLAATLTAAPWSPSTNTAPANMVQVTGNVYDGGGVGDSNLTQVTQYPGGTAVPRVTQNFYDWRDRLVAGKQGVQASENDGTHRPILYQDYDNLNEVTAREQYDGDGLTITSMNGVPVRPPEANRRARTAMVYDDQGRVYQSSTFNVVQSGANAGTLLPSDASPYALTTNTWYDHCGNTIKTSAPGGLVTKTVYDGADRATVRYTTDGLELNQTGTSWAKAQTLAGDNILEQTETTYDPDSNPILVVTRQRFHDETKTGVLSDPAGDPMGTLAKARVSYGASYYDAADRLTAQVDVGTNHGTAYTRPATVPPRSNTVLVTSYGYQADTVQQVSFRGPPSGTFTLTVTVQGMSQPTAPIAYNAAAAAVQSALNQALTTLGKGGSVQVVGPAGGPWNVRFVGSLIGMPVVNMTGTASGYAVIVGTTSEGGDTDRQQQITDPRGLIQKTDYDLLGRTVRTIAAYANFVPSNMSDGTTEYTYDGANHMLTLTARLPNNVSQTTQYVYGVSGSIINSNDLLAQVVYPPNGQPNTEGYAYNALGEVTTKMERNFNVSMNLPQTHVYAYDVLGRQISDTVTVLGDGVDGTVLRFDTAYDTGDRPYLYTSYADTAGTMVVNQVEQVYNGLGQLITEYQEHSGAVNLNTSLKVQYVYNEMANGTNNSRLLSMTYPTGRVLDYNYASGVDDRISRLTSLQNSNETQPLEVESYLGLDTVVKRAHPQAGVDLTYIQQPNDPLANQDGGDQYTGLDRFGRIIDQFWISEANGAATDRFQYGYDADGNVLYRANLVNHNFDELYHASGAGNGYDNFNQLPAFARGVLSASPTGGGVLDTVANPTHSQSWNLDPLGNWLTFTNDGTPQVRTNNNQNQITSITGIPTPTYDNNGNTTAINSDGVPVTYDAWNRLVRYGYLGEIRTIYDALGRRVQDSDGATQLYYSASWQVIEEQLGSVMQAQYVWSPVYVDALVERDTNGGPRLYVQQDANWNVTTVVGRNMLLWVPAERYVYDPYGAPTVLDPATWTARSSQYNWIYLHQGGRYDSVSGLYNFRNRDYSPTLGRWMQQDPLGYASGDANFYGYVHNDPSSALDALGLETGSFQGGYVAFSGVTFKNEVSIRSGTVKVADLAPGQKATTISINDLSKVMKRISDLKVSIGSGMDVLITAIIDDRTQVKNYYWYQQVKQESKGEKDPNDHAWKDDGGKTYPYTKVLNGNWVQMHDHPAVRAQFKDIELKDVSTPIKGADGKIQALQFNPVSDKTYQDMKADYALLYKKSEVAMSFITTLMCKGNTKALGHWDWGFTAKIVNGSPEVTEQKAKWTKG